MNVTELQTILKPEYRATLWAAYNRPTAVLGQVRRSRLFENI